jgi:hypothetical protein
MSESHEADKGKDIGKEINTQPNGQGKLQAPDSKPQRPPRPGKVALRSMNFKERVQAEQGDFRLWRLRRPFVGSILMILAGILILVGPMSPSILRFAMLPGSTIWAALLVGALLLVMGIVQMFVPSLSTFTGGVGMVLSLISIIVALGGFIIGMLLGLIGGALGVAWRPNARRLPNKTAKKGSHVFSRPRFSKSG